MKTNKNFPKSKKTSFDTDKALNSKVVKEKRPGKPILNSLEDDEDDVKPLKPTTNSFFDEDYDADEEELDDDDDEEEYDEDEDEDEDEEFEDEDLEEFQKIR